MHKILVSSAPNQPGKSKLFLDKFSYLFSPVVLGLESCLHGLEIVHELLVVLLKSYSRKKSQVRKPTDKERKKVQKNLDTFKSLLRPLDFSDAFFKVARASSFCLSDLTT
jgi:hypothetical protein